MRLGAGRTFVDEHRAIGCGRLVDVEAGDGAPIWILVEDALNQAGSVRTLIANGRQIVGQYIAHVSSPEPVVVVAEAIANKAGTDPVLERQAVGEFAVHERARRQQTSDS